MTWEKKIAVNGETVTIRGSQEAIAFIEGRCAEHAMKIEFPIITLKDYNADTDISKFNRTQIDLVGSDKCGINIPVNK